MRSGAKSSSPMSWGRRMRPSSTSFVFRRSPVSSGRRIMSSSRRCPRTITARSSRPNCVSATRAASANMPDRLKGKVALVVGAGSIGPGWGNGKATAVAFAREGAKVFCADVNLTAAEETAAIIAKEGGSAHACKADATIRAEVAAMVEACRSAYGRVHVLANNVGIAEVGGVVEASEALWDRVMAVNLKSAFLTMKHVIPLMVETGGGSIINISS